MAYARGSVAWLYHQPWPNKWVHVKSWHYRNYPVITPEQQVLDTQRPNLVFLGWAVPRNEELKLIWIRPYFKGPDLATLINKPYLVNCEA